MSGNSGLLQLISQEHSAQFLGKSDSQECIEFEAPECVKRSSNNALKQPPVVMMSGYGGVEQHLFLQACLLAQKTNKTLNNVGRSDQPKAVLASYEQNMTVA
eukprot:1078716-Amphidinium_carterae.1